MKFLLDSCISIFALNELKKAGFEALWVPELGKDPGDEAILKKAFEENYVLITADKDFGDLIYVLGMPHPAVIRLVNVPVKEQGKILLTIIEKHKVDIENKAIITADRFRIRIRPSL